MPSSPLRWLTRFLSRPDRKLDGRPLCSYRCTDEEFAALRNVLREACEGRLPVRRLPWGTHPLSCLYAAEWWRRHYSGGPWKWETILEDISVEWMPLSQLYYLVELGLRFWQRRLLTTGSGRAFLLTLACEGGLPLNLIHKEGAKLRNFFKALLEEFQLYRRAGLSPEQLAENVRDRLPKSLRQPVVYTLSEHLVDAVWKLQTQVGGSNTPLADLDRIDPEWRVKLPMSLGDDTALALIHNLVEEVAKLASTPKSTLRMTRTLTLQSGAWHLQGEITVPGSMTRPELSSILGNINGQMGSRFELYAMNTDQDTTLLALASERTRGSDTHLLLERPPRTRSGIRGPVAAEAHSLYVGSGHTRLGPIPLPGAGALSSLPWVFVSRSEGDSKLEFLGEGTVRTCYPEAWVAVTPDTTLVPVGGDAHCESLGPIADIDRSLYRIAGEVCFRDAEDGHCVVRTRAPTEIAWDYRLVGEILSYKADGTPIYLGRPRVWVYDAKDKSSQALPETLEWRPFNSASRWLPLSGGMLGKVHLHHAVDGQLRFRTSLIILPSDFRLKIHHGSSYREGSIELSSFGDAEVGWRDVPGVTIRRDPSAAGGVALLKCEASGEPPANLIFVLRWNSGAQAELCVPFPARGGRFLDGDEQVLPNNAPVSLDRLGRIRATAISTNPGERFSVSGKLAANDIPTELLRVVWVHEPLRTVAPGRHEIPLSVLQPRLHQMFSSTADTNAYINLSIEGAPSTHQLHVRRFDLAFVPHRDSDQVGITERDLGRCDAATLSRLTVEALPLWEPGSEAVALTGMWSEGMPTGRWPIDSARMSPGPWLVSGWEGDWCRVQPMLWNVPGPQQAVPDECLSLAGAVRVIDPDQRIRALDKVIDRLVNDPGHSDWELVEQYFTVLRDLPATTLDLMDRLIREPKAIALAVLRADQSLFTATWSLFEQLPFSWHLMPIAAWLQAAKTLAEAYRTQLAEYQGDPEAIVFAAFQPFFDRSPEQMAYMKLVSERMQEVVFPTNSPPAPHLLALARTLEGQDAFRRRRQEAEQDLLRVNANATWPQARAIGDWRSMHMARLPPALSGLWINPLPGTRFRTAILNAPIVAALSSAQGSAPPQALVYEVKSLRSFDIRWFDEAYVYTLAMALGLIDAERRR